MNENLKLNEILKGHEGEFFYSPVFGIIQYKEYDNCFLKFIANGVIKILLNPSGKYIDSADEISVYPSEIEKDWNKWNKDNNLYPKHWCKFKEMTGVRNYYLDYICNGPERPTSIEEIKIRNSAINLIRIQQLIQHSYGGRVHYHDFCYGTESLYIIVPISNYFKVVEVFGESKFSHIAFHTKEQAEEFLKYDENKFLLKEYFTMIGEC